MDYFDFSIVQIPFLIVFLTTIVLAYSIGSFILYFAPKCPTISIKYPVFLRLSLGVLMPVVFWALWLSGGQSVLIIGLLPLAYVFYTTKAKKTILSQDLAKPKPQKYGTFLMLAVLVFFLQVFFFTGFQARAIIPPDVSFYAEMAYFLSLGTENFYGNVNALQLAEYNFTAPYHYFELWMCNLVFKLFPSFSLPRLLLFVVYPILIFVFFAGIFEFVASRVNRKWTPFAFAIVGLFVGAVFSDMLYPLWAYIGRWQIVFETKGFVNGTGVFSHFGQKMLPIYILSFWVCVLWLGKCRELSLAVLLLIPIFNIGPAFAIFPSLITLLFLSYALPKHEFESLQLFKKTGWLIVSTMVLIALFYLATGDYFHGQKQVGSTGFLQTNLNVRGLIFGGALRTFSAGMMILVLFSPIIFLVFINQKSRTRFNLDRGLILFVLTLIAFASLTRAFFYGFNSAQLLSYNWPIFSVLGMVFLLSVLLENRHSKFSLPALVIILIFVQNVIFVFNDHVNLRRLRNSDFIKPAFSLGMERVGIFLSKNSSNSIPASLCYYGNDIYTILIDNNFFYLYFLNSKTDFASPVNINGPSIKNTMGLFNSMDFSASPFAAQEFFIKKYKVSYVFVEKSAELPSFLNSARPLPHEFHPNFRLFKLQP